MTDLTQLQTPIGLLPPETQQALREWPHGWEYYDGCWNEFTAWINVQSCDTIRAKPAPAITDSINWEHVAPEWKFMARDKDGDVYLHKIEPYEDYSYWGNHGESQSIKNAFASYTRGTLDWRDSLVARP